MKILIVRFKFLGDVLITSTLCSSLRESFPDAQIDYFMHANSATLFDNNPNVDNVITLDESERKPLAYLAKIWRLTRTRYDIIIDATSTSKTEIISLLSLSSKYRIGRLKKGRGLAYTHRIPKQFDNKIEQRMALLQPLVEAGYEIKFDRKLRLFINQDEINTARSKLEKTGVSQSARVFACSVSSKFDYRSWNLDYMEQVVRHCLEQHNADIVLLPGLPHEQQRIDDFRARFAADARIFNNVSANTLRELFALLSQCQLYVGNEGGQRHFAQAVGLPTVSVFSPYADLNEWLPEHNSRHQAIEWRSVFTGDQEPVYETDDRVYHQLHDLIKPAHVIELIDSVVSQHLDSTVQEPESDLL